MHYHNGPALDLPGGWATSSRMLAVTPLAPADRADWERLFRGYIAFYERDEPQAMYDAAWAAFMADERLHALGARLDGALVGITHFFIHPNTSGPDVCYLQDLFTDEAARGHGAGRALIAAVADWARARLRPPLLADPRDQRHGAGALRQGGGEPRVYPV